MSARLLFPALGLALVVGLWAQPDTALAQALPIPLRPTGTGPRVEVPGTGYSLDVRSISLPGGGEGFRFIPYDAAGRLEPSAVSFAGLERARVGVPAIDENIYPTFRREDLERVGRTTMTIPGVIEGADARPVEFARPAPGGGAPPPGGGGPAPGGGGAPVGGGGGGAARSIVPCIEGPCRLQQLLDLGANVFNFLMGILAVSAVAALVVAGFQYVTGRGDPAILKAAKQKVFFAVTGLLIALFAVILVNFVLKTLGVGGGGPGGGVFQVENVSGDTPLLPFGE